MTWLSGLTPPVLNIKLVQVQTQQLYVELNVVVSVACVMHSGRYKCVITKTDDDDINKTKPNECFQLGKLVIKYEAF